jgi:hypothetical protein
MSFGLTSTKHQSLETIASIRASMAEESKGKLTNGHSNGTAVGEKPVTITNGLSDGTVVGEEPVTIAA